MRKWLDDLTGRVTMYRVVLIALIALLIEALLVSLLGQLAYSSLAILLNATVAVIATVFSNVLFARVLRVAPHYESSLITGMILLFLFQPTLSAIGLGAVALAGVFASASKYLLAVRHRHVFNPAATGAFVVSVILPSWFPGWWVANPWLLPLTAVCTFVILYRSRRLAMGVLFVVVATLAVVSTQLSFGTPLSTALSTAVVSYPIVFFAGFMLSEPLTLPPRQWQQLCLAVIVGGLFAVTGSVGPVIWSYPLALMVGNLLAFLVGQRHGIRLSYIGKRPLDSTSWELSFRPHRSVKFVAGQYMELTLPHSRADVRGMRRVFSIASAPSVPQVVSFGLRTAEPSSSFKSALLTLSSNDVVTATSIGGDFVLPRDAAKPLLLVAGGIGITPFISQLTELETIGEHRDVVLVYAASSAHDLAYSDQLDTQRVLLIAPEAPTMLSPLWSYLGPGPVTAELLRAALPDLVSRDAYVSGPPGLVRALRKSLRRAGVRRVRTDYFAGY